MCEYFSLTASVILWNLNNDIWIDFLHLKKLSQKNQSPKMRFFAALFGLAIGQELKCHICASNSDHNGNLIGLTDADCHDLPDDKPGF